MIQSRSMSWIVESNRLSPNQKGSFPCNGLQTHVFSTKTAISDFLHTSGMKYMCYVDIRDAFGSINHKFMIDELKRAGYPSLFINITADVYNNSTFQVKTACGLTQPIKRHRGVIQGCPWSIIIFNRASTNGCATLKATTPEVTRVQFGDMLTMC